MYFRYDTDVKNLDPKYRKPVVLAAVSGPGMSGAGISGAGVTGVGVSGAGISGSGISGAPRTMDSSTMRGDHAGATGCNNCTLL